MLVASLGVHAASSSGQANPPPPMKECDQAVIGNNSDLALCQAAVEGCSAGTTDSSWCQSLNQIQQTCQLAQDPSTVTGCTFIKWLAEQNANSSSSASSGS